MAWKAMQGRIPTGNLQVKWNKRTDSCIIFQQTERDEQTVHGAAEGGQAVPSKLVVGPESKHWPHAVNKSDWAFHKARVARQSWVVNPEKLMSYGVLQQLLMIAIERTVSEFRREATGRALTTIMEEWRDHLRPWEQWVWWPERANRVTMSAKGAMY